MAQLDVRERRIEATIAYLGPDLAGKSTNLRCLRGDAASLDDAAVDDVAMDWRPIGHDPADACDVAVRLIARSGTLADLDVARALDEADGVVVVLDGDPAARERNRAWVDAAREHLTRAAGARTPIVVQVNKSDLPDALPLESVVQELGVGAWRHLAASAARGEGVFETARAALEDVLAGAPPAGEGAARPLHRADAHPLLDALRQILRESIDERMDAVEERMAARVAELVDARLAATVASLREPAATTQDLVAAMRRELRAESGEDRDRLAAHVAALRRMLDGLRTELQPVDVRPQLQALDGRLGRLAAKVDELGATLGPAAASLRAMPVRLGEAQERTRLAVVTTVEEIGRRLEDALDAHRASSAPVWQRIDERSAKVDASVDELIDELKKRKRGWFG